MAGTTNLSKKQRQKRIAYYRDWMAHCYQMLGLDHWEIVAGAEPCADNATAEVHLYQGQVEARILFSDDYFAAKPETQRSTLLHELLHCHFRPIRDAMNDLEDAVGGPVWAVFDKARETAEEAVVDGLAHALAPLFPLPPRWADRKKPERSPGGSVELSGTTVFSDGERITRPLILPEGSVAALAAAVTKVQVDRLAATDGHTPVFSMSMAKALCDTLPAEEPVEVAGSLGQEKETEADDAPCG